jgi:hypothetical protein
MTIKPDPEEALLRKYPSIKRFQKLVFPFDFQLADVTARSPPRDPRIKLVNKAFAAPSGISLCFLID